MLSFALLAPAFVLPGLRPAAPPGHAIAMTELWQRRGFGGPLPEGILKEETSLAAVTKSLSMTRSELLAAVCGVVVCSVAGSAASSTQTDTVLQMLGAADMYNENVLYTDLLVKGVDVANVAGLVVLPLAIAYLISLQRADLTEAEEDWVCVISEFAEEICGRPSFDSTDQMTCVEANDGRWVCV